jgi:hypothetical protein
MRRAILSVIAAGLTWGGVLSAQDAATDLRIRLNAIDGSPITGALVALLNDRDSVVAEGLTNDAGMRVLRAPRGTYRLRVRRIGYLPFVSSELSLPRTELALTVESPRVELASIVVTSRSRCRRTDPNAEALSTVWDEIDKALSSSQLTLQDLSGIGRARVYRKEVRSDGTVISGDSSTFAIHNRRPFGAVDPKKLAAEGYVTGDVSSGWSYYGPDEEVLRSEQFAATHCFRLVRERGHQGQIGVSFEPTPQREIADIAGVLWVDESTSELREMVFRFVNARELSWYNAGGFTRFRRVRSGAWIVDEWQLSVPKLEFKQSTPFPARLVVTGRYENGGGVIRPDAPKSE